MVWRAFTTLYKYAFHNEEGGRFQCFFFCHDPSFPLHLEPNYLWHHQHHHHSHRQMLHHDDCSIMGCLLSGPMLGKNRCNMVLISSYWFILAIWWLLLLLLHMQKCSKAMLYDFRYIQANSKQSFQHFLKLWIWLIFLDQKISILIK